MTKTKEPFIPDASTVRYLRKVLKRGGKLQVLAVNAGRSRYLPMRALVPVAAVKGRIVNLSVQITSLLNIKWAGDDSIRSLSDPYDLTRRVALALYGDPKALTRADVSC